MRLLYFSPVAWDSYEQRPHYFVRDFLGTGGDSVIWINPYAARLPSLADLSRDDLRRPPLMLARPRGLAVIDPGGLPIDPLPGGRWLNQRLFWNRWLKRLAATSSGPKTLLGIGRPTALALAALDVVRADASFYDAMDDFPEFYRGRSRAATRLVEAHIARRVDRIIVSSGHLRDKFSSGDRPITLLRNAYDMSLLPPFVQQVPASPHVGFIGCLGGWFDWPTVIRLAEAMPRIQVTLVGPRAAAVPRELPANIDVRPQCSQVEGAQILRSFTAGLIPFVRSALTAGVDPIKYYQYRGAGLPVLSTRFGDMAARGSADDTFFLDDASGLPHAVEAAAACRPAATDVALFRETNTWASRFRDADLWRLR